VKIAHYLIISIILLSTSVGNGAAVRIVVKNDELVDVTGGSTIKILGQLTCVEDKQRNHKVAEFTDKGFQLSGPSISLAKDFSICFWMKASGAEERPVLVSNRPWKNIDKGFTLGGKSKNVLLSLGKAVAGGMVSLTSTG
jgi:hypothetical protein